MASRARAVSEHSRRTAFRNTDSITARKVAERSMLIKNMIEDLGDPGAEPIPIMNVSATSHPHPTSTIH